MKIINILLLVFTLFITACQSKTGNESEVNSEKLENTDDSSQNANTNYNSSEKYSKEELEKMKEADRKGNPSESLSGGAPAASQKKSKTQLIRGSDGKLILPNACDLVSGDQMASWLKLDPGQLDLIDGSPKGGDSRSCFFKWDDPQMPNTAVLIQIMRNMVEDEVPDWPTYFINSKLEAGEKEMVIEGERTHIFKAYDEFGDAGAYNTDVSKWYWRIGNDAIVMIAFNTYFSADFKSSVVSKIGKEIMPKL